MSGGETFFSQFTIHNSQFTIKLVFFIKAAQAFCGKIKQAPTNLSTNPAYFQGFGE
jgi:hypothetical protein